MFMMIPYLSWNCVSVVQLSTMCESCLDTPEAKIDDIARGIPTKKKNDDSNQDNDNQAENISVDEEDEGKC